MKWNKKTIFVLFCFVLFFDPYGSLIGMVYYHWVEKYIIPNIPHSVFCNIKRLFQIFKIYHSIFSYFYFFLMKSILHFEIIYFIPLKLFFSCTLWWFLTIFFLPCYFFYSSSFFYFYYFIFRYFLFFASTLIFFLTSIIIIFQFLFFKARFSPPRAREEAEQQPMPSCEEYSSRFTRSRN